MARQTVMPAADSHRQARPAVWREERIEVRTSACLEIIDLTDRLREIVHRAAIGTGTLLVQSLHTTAAMVVNESEPLLLEDLKRSLEETAPRWAAYRHDDFGARTVNMTAEERPNGHAHCKALFLPTSVTLGISGGCLLLGRWQRVFLIELDRARARTVAIVAAGAPLSDLGP